MIRIIVRTVQDSPVPNSPSQIHFKTFDIDVPELEKFMLGLPHYANRDIVGVEIVAAKEAER